MFEKEIYVARRTRLKRLVGEGLILLPGNNDSPVNYPSNCYTFRQDSTFLYYFGQQRDGLWGIIDVDNDCEYLLGDEISIDDIVWFGSVTSVPEMAAQVGVANSGPASEVERLVLSARKRGQTIHFLPPYRFDTKIALMDLLGLHPRQQKDAASLRLIHAVVEMRSVKQPEEIARLEEAAAIGYKMHTTAMRMCRPGVAEQQIGGAIDGIANAYGCMVSFQSIVTMHGEIMHGNPTPRKLEAGRLMLCDAGAETNDNYCSDNTRTTPIGGKFSERQKEIYQIVVDCHDHAQKISRPGVKYWDVHMAICRIITERLTALGLMKGNADEAVRAGAHALFLPHGLGHMMGMDVHDMEGLGQVYVGFDDEVRPSTQFGTNALRCGRRLQKGFVVTDEPGIYFIPDLIDYWRANNICADFLNFDKVEQYKDFGGIRIEDDLLITDDGCRFIGKQRIPYHIADVEQFMAERNE